MSKTIFALTTAAAVASTMAFAGAASARDQINIVGSSTVFPFATAVAEKFGNKSDFKTPKVESTGSGGGLKLFCKAVGADTPDIANSSRRMKMKEYKSCQENGVKDIVEFKIGYDGIVVANAKTATPMNLSLKQLYLALAANVPDPKGGETLIANPYTKWSDIDPSLPDYKIEVLGPPPTSGTRDAFQELAMEGGCHSFEFLKAMAKTDKEAHKKACMQIRADGPYVEAGENDNLIVSKLEANDKAVGVFGFSFLDQNSDKMQGAVVDGQTPTFEAISSGDYPVSRSLFFYVKKAHIGVIPGLKEYLAEWTSPGTFGPEGYLVEKGLIPLPEDERKAAADKAEKLPTMSGEEKLG